MHTKAANAIDVHVGSQIRLRRKALHITQTTLGERLGITFQQVQKYERGSNRVGASRLQAIADILGVEAAFFFASLPNEASASTAQETGQDAGLRSFISSNEGFALNEAFFKIKDPLTRRRIIGLVRSVASRSIDADQDDI